LKLVKGKIWHNSKGGRGGALLNYAERSVTAACLDGAKLKFGGRRWNSGTRF